MELNEHACALVARVNSVDLNSVAWNALFTVPTGKKFVPHFVVIRKLSADAGSATVTLGQSGAKTDFLNTQALSNLSAAGKAGILMPVPNATTVAIVEYAAATVLGVDVTAAAGAACTATFEVFGTLIDA